MRKAPHIYQINTWTWLHALRQKYDDHITLGSIPQSEMDPLITMPIDAVWLMGIWERSPAGVKIAAEHPGLQNEYRHALDDFDHEDVVGSPYSIRNYNIDPNLGNRQELVAFRAQLADYGIGLILDYVPNHVATDHPWTIEHPEYLIQGTDEEAIRRPHDFFAANGTVFAYGRDPYFPAWTDTAQVNAFHMDLRQAVIDLLTDIASLCDGIRCDMAMLMVTRIFKQTWGNRSGELPPTEFWEDVIPAVHASNPEFLFIAEVYWNMESELLQQGFDYCYNKGLYDKLEGGTADEVRDMVNRDLDYQGGLIHFIENHDEQRAVSAFGFNRAWVSALTIATLPGAKLWHEGQFVGHHIKLPVQLGRRPVEPDDEYLFEFYQLLLSDVQNDIYREGEWQVCPVRPAWHDNASYQSIYAYFWQCEDDYRLIVVNFSENSAQGSVMLTLPQEEQWQFRDILGNKLFERDGQETAHNGLFVDLNGWSGHLFRVIAK
ncbi:MAG: alpha-amylase [Chloroflexi bacterium]|nr:alpha-amylase [Chloroflexota bacterium]